MNCVIWDDRTRQIIDEVQARIRAVYPEAVFRVGQEEEPVGVYIDAYTDAEDSFCIFDLVNDWLLNILIDEGRSFHVIPQPRRCAPTPHV